MAQPPPPQRPGSSADGERRGRWSYLTRCGHRQTGANNFLLLYQNLRDYHNDDPYKPKLLYLNPPLLYPNLLDYHNNDVYKLLLPYLNLLQPLLLEPAGLPPQRRQLQSTRCPTTRGSSG